MGPALRNASTTTAPSAAPRFFTAATTSRSTRSLSTAIGGTLWIEQLTAMVVTIVLSVVATVVITTIASQSAYP